MLHDFSPLVTVLIPVYNGADYLGIAIESALAQTYPNIEVVVVNDGSTDNGATEAVARSFGQRIRYVRKDNGGVASALNRGIAEAQGHYISWLSHDDFYYPAKVATQVEYLRLLEAPDTLTFTAIRLVDENGATIRDHIVEPRWLRDVALTVLSTSVNGCATLVPRSAFNLAGIFDETLKTVQDNDLWLRMALAGVPFAYLPVPLVASRLHPGQTSVRIRDVHAGEKELFYTRALRALGPRFESLADDIIDILVSKNLPESARLARAMRG
ncbi:glycosyltransferase [Nitratidesulfovibrio vulgaris]|uniref:glycosyltransferase n=1 Tax=Nitratidesulfovibrio vulgaris TaxID=881 RepID=UPI002300DF05|nr:glycosyltransferase [Nitratidesulfovibrio vulgaris]WCB46370.1 glycosyltransferase [Nitratidesulfovibrio vulgaris]